ncbi:hypothetical protein M404DRAFT_143760, partial [Pisolithus tinctorius Marx 270]
YHLICFAVENHSFHLIYCPTDNMVANTLTKPLEPVQKLETTRVCVPGHHVVVIWIVGTPAGQVN